MIIVWKLGFHDAETANKKTAITHNSRETSRSREVPEISHEEKQTNIPATDRAVKAVIVPRVEINTRDSGVYLERNRGSVRKEMNPRNIAHTPTTTGLNSQTTKKY